MRFTVRVRRRRATLLVAGLAVLVPPAAAQAGTLTQEGSSLVYSAAPGERNHLRITTQGTGVVDLLEQRSETKLVSRTASCNPTGPNPQARENMVRCGLSGITDFDVRLGDAADSFGSQYPIRARVDGGGGDDTYVGFTPRLAPGFGAFSGASQVTFHGGAGRDLASYQLFTDAGVIVTKDDQPFDGRRGDRDDIRSDVEMVLGSGHDDFLAGGEGQDIFESSGGSDQLVGGGGDDLFLMSARRDGPTRVLAGAGRDTVSYAERSNRLSISLDSDSSPDGETGEGDRIAEAEVVEGGTHNDTIVTPATTTLGYRLIGGRGRDLLSSGFGKDRLIGGPESDVLASGPGRDVIEAVDLGRDERVDCGSNGDDVAELDRGDPATGCEVRIVPGSFVGVLGLTDRTPARPDGTARLEMRWRHPVAWRRLRQIRMTVHDGERVAGRLTIRPRAGRAAAVRQGGLRLRGPVRRAGRTVRAPLALRVPAVGAGPLVAEIAATDANGRRQVERRSVVLTGGR